MGYIGYKSDNIRYKVIHLVRFVHKDYFMF